MISREPTIERLAIARRRCCSSRSASTEASLTAALRRITEHRIDDADLYFQYTRSEGWSLEEGIVKSGSFGIDQGVGVRAVAGEKTAFAYSDDISEAALLDAARHRAHDRRRRPEPPRQGAGARRTIAGSRALYAPMDPIATLDSTQKVALLEKVEKLARAKDPRIVQVMAGLAGEYDVVLVARADGTLAADVRPLVRLSVTVIAEQNGRREVGTGGGGGRFGLGYFHDDVIAELRRPGGQRGADQPRVAPGAGRRDERRARPGLARRAAARGDRPRPRRRLQPQGLERVLRPHRPARRGQGRDGARRRHDRRSPRLAERRRRRQRRRSATC